MKELAQRKPNRMSGYDYSQNGAYFVTICAKDQAKLFSDVGATVLGRPCPIHLSEIGQVIDAAIQHNNRNGITIDCYVIMPNHIHLIVVIASQGGVRVQSPLQTIIRNIKAYISATEQGCVY
jgi:REP element-mobilizing transposase RayT